MRSLDALPAYNLPLPIRCAILRPWCCKISICRIFQQSASILISEPALRVVPPIRISPSIAAWLCRTCIFNSSFILFVREISPESVRLPPLLAHEFSNRFSCCPPRPNRMTAISHHGSAHFLSHLFLANGRRFLVNGYFIPPTNVSIAPRTYKIGTLRRLWQLAFHRPRTGRPRSIMPLTFTSIAWTIRLHSECPRLLVCLGFSAIGNCAIVSVRSGAGKLPTIDASHFLSGLRKPKSRVHPRPHCLCQIPDSAGHSEISNDENRQLVPSIVSSQLNSQKLNDQHGMLVQYQPMRRAISAFYSLLAANIQRQTS